MINTGVIMQIKYWVFDLKPICKFVLSELICIETQRKAHVSGQKSTLTVSYGGPYTQYNPNTQQFFTIPNNKFPVQKNIFPVHKSIFSVHKNILPVPKNIFPVHKNIFPHKSLSLAGYQITSAIFKSC